MKRLTDTLAGMLLTIFIAYELLGMIRPYALYIVIGAILWFFARSMLRRYTDW